MPLVDAQIGPKGCFVSIIVHATPKRFAALMAAGQNNPAPFTGLGLVDPGASNTMIDRSVVAFLGLQSTGVGRLLTPTTGSTPHNCNQYDVSVWFPQAPTLVQAKPSAYPVHLTLPVSETDFSAQGFHVLIGRDILSHGVFIFNGLCGRFMLGF
jgi:hypothetical protein